MQYVDEVKAREYYIPVAVPDMTMSHLVACLSIEDLTTIAYNGWSLGNLTEEVMIHIWPLDLMQRIWLFLFSLFFEESKALSAVSVPLHIAKCFSYHRNKNYTKIIIIKQAKISFLELQFDLEDIEGFMGNILSRKALGFV